MDFFAFLISIIDRIIVPLVFALAFLAFIWGIFRFFFNDNEEKRKEGRQFALAGILGFFLMLSIWGLTRGPVNTSGFRTDTRRPRPYFDP